LLKEINTANYTNKYNKITNQFTQTKYKNDELEKVKNGIDYRTTLIKITEATV